MNKHWKQEEERFTSNNGLKAREGRSVDGIGELRRHVVGDFEATELTGDEPNFRDYSLGPGRRKSLGGLCSSAET